MDDFDNPSFVFVDQALDQFETVEGSAGKAVHHAMSLPKFSGLRAICQELILMVNLKLCQS